MGKKDLALMTKTSSNNQFATDSLEAIRNRLLDLTGRNRLLKFKHTGRALVRIIDELPDQLTELLLKGNSVTFVPIPEPTRDELIEHGYIRLNQKRQEEKLKPNPNAREWAKILGFDTSYDLEAKSYSKDKKHNDTNIQTLFFPHELEALLRNIRSKANTAIEETGANILYIAFGFLEWFEDAESEVPRQAPLYLIPVKIEKAQLDKKAGVYQYTIQYTGEDIVSNLSLREKLKIDFHLGLPEIEDEDLPEEYFARVKDNILKHKPKWSIKRYATLSMFDFGKLLMYLDLDPSKWPDGTSNITNHDILKKFFSSSAEENDSSGSYGFAEEYEIDEIESVHDTYPLIDDADSSQHSAIVDAINGQNLVIEGPPGSGKSQTITNLIAALIAQGKKVLFVAEKMAALNVVKARLERAGLGDFCLELHSNKIQKKQVYESIRQRINNQDNYVYPNRISLDIKLYETKKEELTKYASLINSEWKNTKLTIHQIFTKTTRYRQQFEGMSLDGLYPSDISGEAFDEATCQSMVDELKRYALVFENIRGQLGSSAHIESHPWFGIQNTKIQMFDTSSVCELLAEWQESLKELSSFVEEVNSKVGTEGKCIDDVQELLKQRELLPEIVGNERLDAIGRYTPQRLTNITNILGKYQEGSELFNALSEIFEREVFQSKLSENDLLKAASSAQTVFTEKNVRLDTIHHTVEDILTIITLFDSVFEDIEIIKQQAPSIASLFDRNIESIQEFQTFLLLHNDLPAALINSRNELMDNEDLDTLLPKLKVVLDDLQPLHERLTGLFELDILPTATELSDYKTTVDNSGFFSWLSGDWREAKKILCGLSKSTKPKLKSISAELENLILYRSLLDKLNGEEKYQTLLKEQFKGVHTDVNSLIAVREWYKKLRTEYGFGFGKRTPFANFMFTESSDTFKAIQHLATSKSLDEISSVITLINKVKQIVGIQSFNDPTLPLNTATLTQIHDDLLNVVISLQSKTKVNLSLAEILTNITEFKRAVELEQAVSKSNIIVELFGDEVSLNLRLRDEELIQSIVNTNKLYAQLLTISHDTLRGHLIANIQNNGLEDISKQLEQLQRLYDHQVASLADFQIKVKLDERSWLLTTDGSLEQIIERNQKAISQPEWMVTWLDFLKVRNFLANKGLENLLLQTERGELKLADLEDIFQFAVFDILSREIISENENLADFSGANHSAIRQQFREYDEKLKSLQQQKIAYFVAKHGIEQLVPGNNSGRVATYTEMGLINNEINKKTRHTPIRQAIRRAGRSLQALKPCFMMGPNSVAQFLEPGKINFDVVVMDEASQIKPEDALGTIARGSRLVVVGDPKQLPPTSFFDKTVENDSEDATAIEQSESILDVSIPMFNLRRLRWHYRSRHESLIAFSNSEFYDSNLVIFPSPVAKSDEFGIKFTHVKRGYFVNQRNVEEAQVIAEAVRNHLINRPHESLGVVAMSAQQREQIERCVEELSKDDALFMNALFENEMKDEPLFLKNLENVQGDERDVIFISCTYGPQKAGLPTMPQRFGPINTAAGGRRLNVLFTRSKKRMHIFSSMTEGHIQISENSHAGLKALKRFLGFAQTGNIHQVDFTQRAPDSDFEIAVMEALANEGFESVPQVGVGGYFIDIAVKDPGQPGRYLMGIECDGATYHSAKSARDRDRLRQSVLESLGWNIKRIWSTDWFKNPQAQLRPIIEELHKLKTEYIPTDDVSEADEIEHIVEDEVADHVETDEISNSTLGLREKLVKFNQDVILPNSSGVDESNLLLRPAMLDALCEFKPASKSEFIELIPGYLRSSTSPKQGVFIEKVLNIIAEAELDTID